MLISLRVGISDFQSCLVLFLCTITFIFTFMMFTKQISNLVQKFPTPIKLFLIYLAQTTSLVTHSKHYLEVN